MSKHKRNEFKLSLIELCSRALEADIGIKIEVDNPEQFAPYFYLCRKEHSEFSILTLMNSPDGPGHFWIVKGKSNVEE